MDGLARGWLVTLGYFAGTAILLARPLERLRSRRERASSRGPPPSTRPREALAPSTAADAEDDVPFPAAMPRGDVTVAELRKHDGSDPARPLLLAAKGVVYDVSRGRDFYGRGGAYHAFAGADCSRALAKMSLDPTFVSADVSDATPEEMKVLDDWVARFESKYPRVGRLVDGTYPRGGGGDPGAP